MRKRTVKGRGFLLLCGMLFLSPPFHAASLNQIIILKISAPDRSAVIRSEDKVRLVKPGDTLAENSRVLEIGEGRIVVEEDTAQGKETVIIFLENGKQRMERIKRGGRQDPVLYAP